MNGAWGVLTTERGPVHVAVLEDALVHVDLGEASPGRMHEELAKRFPDATFRHDPDDPAVAGALGAMQAYLAGETTTLDLPLRLRGTPFQEQVWKALRDIPRGEVRSYAQVAAAVGRPGAARAVGQANHANPVAVVVPCHRVVAADGSLGGYMGGPATADGWKAHLLRLEGALP